MNQFKIHKKSITANLISKQLCKFHDFSFSEWLDETNKPVQFENLPKDEIAVLLRVFYAAVCTKMTLPDSTPDKV